jgi:hypothetical protein
VRILKEQGVSSGEAETTDFSDSALSVASASSEDRFSTSGCGCLKLMAKLNRLAKSKSARAFASNPGANFMPL